MFSEVAFKVGSGEDIGEYVINTDKRVGAFENVERMNVYTDLFHYDENTTLDFETIENYLNINHSTEDIRQGFLTTWLRQRTRDDVVGFRLEYDHMYIPVNPSHGNRNGITYQVFDDGVASPIDFTINFNAYVMLHNNYTGENTLTYVHLSHSHMGERGEGFSYVIDPYEVIREAGIPSESIPTHLHLVNAQIFLTVHDMGTPFEMRTFNVINDLVTQAEAHDIIENITNYENSGSSLDDIALDQLFEGVVKVLKVELFPNISLWLVMSALMGILLLVWFVKLFAGG